MTEKTELDPLFPPELTLTVAGEELTLTAFKAKNMRAYLGISRRLTAKAELLGHEMGQALQKLQAYEAARETNPDTPYPDLGGIPGSMLALDANGESQIPLELLHERCYDEYFDLVKTATGKPASWVEELGIDELVLLAGIINQLNATRYAPKKPGALTTPATSQS